MAKMTIKELQEFLDAEKWKDSEIHACDMCGRYARCHYCDRNEQFPCAMAHNRLMSAIHAPVPDRIPDWLLPDPEVPSEISSRTVTENVRENRAEEDRENTNAQQQFVQPQMTQTDALQSTKMPAVKESAEDVKEAVPVRKEAFPAPAVPRTDEPPHVVKRGMRGDVRLCKIGRRIPTVSVELEES